MPRYRFDVSDGQCAEDVEGIELPDERAARREAIRRVAMLVRASNNQPETPRTWRLNVKDAAGAVVFWIDGRLGIALPPD